MFPVNSESIYSVCVCEKERTVFVEDIEETELTRSTLTKLVCIISALRTATVAPAVNQSYCLPASW